MNPLSLVLRIINIFLPRSLAAAVRTCFCVCSIYTAAFEFQFPAFQRGKSVLYYFLGMRKAEEKKCKTPTKDFYELMWRPKPRFWRSILRVTFHRIEVFDSLCLPLKMVLHVVTTACNECNHMYVATCTWEGGFLHVCKVNAMLCMYCT